MPINFELCGTILGLAIYNQQILDLSFPEVVYKKLLHETITFHDIKDIEPEMYSSWVKLLAYDGKVEDFGLYFVVEYERFGEPLTYDLVEGGSETVMMRFLEWVNESVVTMLLSQNV